MAGIHLEKKTRIWINTIGVAVWATGIAWVMAHFFFKSEDSLGLPVHSSEPLWLKLHGASAFLAVWTGGLMWGLHVVKAWNSGRHRISGASIFGVLVILCVTGYLLYYVADDDARAAVSVIHWVLGCALPLVYLAHRLNRKRS
jgi:hypothetical protein